MSVLTTHNLEETQEVAKDVALSLRLGDIICLYGDLGSGKTTFAQGLAKGLGLKQRITSPTFVIIRKYDVSSKLSEVRSFYHIDLYRIETERDLEGIGLQEILEDKNAIVVIEWAEKLKNMLPKKRIDIKLEVLVNDSRKITIDRYE